MREELFSIPHFYMVISPFPSLLCTFVIITYSKPHTNRKTLAYLTTGKYRVLLEQPNRLILLPAYEPSPPGKLYLAGTNPVVRETHCISTKNSRNTSPHTKVIKYIIIIMESWNVKQKLEGNVKTFQYSFILVPTVFTELLFLVFVGMIMTNDQAQHTLGILTMLKPLDNAVRV
jgi:hypothetical protein